MRTLFVFVMVLSLLSLQNCKDDCTGCNVPPLPSIILIPTLYTTDGNLDLLDPSVVGSFKENDIKVTTTVEQNGILKELDPSETPIRIGYNNAIRKNYFYLPVPTNANKNPIRTIVQLRQGIVDTVTYSYQGKQRPHIPDKIYYNKKLVWEVVGVPDEGSWSPIIIIK